MSFCCSLYRRGQPTAPSNPRGGGGGVYEPERLSRQLPGGEGAGVGQRAQRLALYHTLVLPLLNYFKCCIFLTFWTTQNQIQRSLNLFYSRKMFRTIVKCSVRNYLSWWHHFKENTPSQSAKTFLLLIRCFVNTTIRSNGCPNSRSPLLLVVKM